jgi:ACS family tartrate transporter-like MFS transporter
MAGEGAGVDPAPRALGAKVGWRLGLPVIALMLLSSLDRVNLSFAALGMNGDLGLTPSQYGLGAGLVFVGFLAGQYPSVLLLQRLGMHRWIALCAIVWGACAAGTAFVRSPQQLYVLRIVLGFAEGGLGPGIVLYLSQFVTERERALTFALPMLAIPLSVVVGSPVSGWLMTTAPSLGLTTWRWMLLAEALPTILFGLAAYLYFPDRAEQAAWLTPEERRWLQQRAASGNLAAVANDWSILRTPLVWASGALWFCLLSGSYGIIFWLPQMIKQLTGGSAIQIGLVNALPWGGAMLGMYCNSRHSDRTGERFWHVGLPAALAALAILAAWNLGAGVAGLAALLVAGIGLGAAQGAFWALPTALLTQRTLAVAAVAINVAGSAGGLVMPHLMGFARESSGGFGGPTMLVAGILLAASALVAIIGSGALRARAG